MCLDMMVVSSKCMHMSIGDDVHVHSLPKYQLHSSAHAQKCEGHGLDTIEALG